MPVQGLTSSSSCLISCTSTHIKCMTGNPKHPRSFVLSALKLGTIFLHRCSSPYQEHPEVAYINIIHLCTGSVPTCIELRKHNRLSSCIGNDKALRTDYTCAQVLHNGLQTPGNAFSALLAAVQSLCCPASRTAWQAKGMSDPKILRPLMQAFQGSCSLL